MAPDHKHGSSRAAESILRRPRRLLLVAGTTSACFAVLIVIIVSTWLLCAGRSGDDDLNNRVPAGVLADYVPADSAALLVVDIRQFRETPMGRQHLWPAMKQLAQRMQWRLPWLKLVGVNLL